MKKKAEERIAEYKDQVLDMADEALLTIQEKLSSPNHAVALRAALEVLAINGISGTRKSESQVTVTTKSELDAQIERLLNNTPASHTNAQSPDMLGVSTGNTDTDAERDE